MRGAAIAMHARVQLYESNWQAVITDCERLINADTDGAFELFSNYEELFSVAAEYNSEVIFDLQFGGSRLQGIQRAFLPPTIGRLRPVLVPTQSLVDNYIMLNGKSISDPTAGYDIDNPYENRDPRFSKTIVYHGSEMVDFAGVSKVILTQPGSNPNDNSIENQNGSATGYYFRKYYDRTAVDYASSVNLILIRYADVLLMYAEAKNQLGQMTVDVWNKTIRAIRQRAGFTAGSALDFDNSLSQDQLTSIIRQERRSELAFEGLRIFDIRRWKTAASVMNVPAKGIKISSAQFPQDENGFIIVQDRAFDDKHYLWPVPQYEIDQNQNLAPNNPGW